MKLWDEEGTLEIICPQCNNKSRHEITNASIIKHVYSRLIDKTLGCRMEIRCNKCRYLADSWELLEVTDQDFKELKGEVGCQ